MVKKMDLMDKEPDNFFNFYGTHVITETLVGANYNFIVGISTDDGEKYHEDLNNLGANNNVTMKLIIVDRKSIEL